MGPTRLRLFITVLAVLAIYALSVSSILSDSISVGIEISAELTCEEAVVENDSITSLAITDELLAIASSNSIWIYRIGEWQTPQWHFTEHDDIVNDVEFSLNGEMLASASSDTTVIVWNAETGELIHRLQDPDYAEVWSVSFDPASGFLATGSSRYRNSGALRLWDITTGDEIKTIQEGVNNSDNVLAFSSTGLLASAETLFYRIVVRSINPVEEVVSLEGHDSVITSLAFTTDGSILASGSWDQTIRLWDAECGNALSILTGHSESINALSFVPEQPILISGSGSYQSSRDNSVRFWDITTNQEVFSFRDYENPIIDLAISSGGTILAIAEYGRGVHICRILSGED